MLTAINTTETVSVIKDTTANPAPLGLLGFGMTTVLLNLHNAGLFELDAMIMGMGIFMGGIAQLMAGWQEWKEQHFWCNSIYSIRIILAIAGSFMVNSKHVIRCSLQIQ